MDGGDNGDSLTKPSSCWYMLEIIGNMLLAYKMSTFLSRLLSRLSYVLLKRGPIQICLKPPTEQYIHEFWRKAYNIKVRYPIGMNRTISNSRHKVSRIISQDGDLLLLVGCLYLQEYDKYLKKAGEYGSRNFVNITNKLNL